MASGGILMPRQRKGSCACPSIRPTIFPELDICLTRAPPCLHRALDAEVLNFALNLVS